MRPWVQIPPLGPKNRHFRMKMAVFSCFLLLKLRAKNSLFHLTTEIPQTGFWFDHRRGSPFQKGFPSFLFYAAQDLSIIFRPLPVHKCTVDILACLQKQVSSWELMTPTACR